MPPKRGGRGGHGGTFKAGFASKKRGSPSGDNESSGAPSFKKAKAKADDEDVDEGGSVVVPVLKKDDDGNDFVGLNASGKRRVTVSEFSKNMLVSIREYWTNDAGELKPGKKGISLTVDQYNTLLAAAPLIEAALAKKNVTVVRPDYEADLGAGEEDGDEQDVQVAKVEDEDEVDE